MDRVQELEAVEAAIEALEAEVGDYAINDIADLVGLPTRVVREHIHQVGCRPEWTKLRNKLTPMGYWKLND